MTACIILVEIWHSTYCTVQHLQNMSHLIKIQALRSPPSPKCRTAQCSSGCCKLPATEPTGYSTYSTICSGAKCFQLIQGLHSTYCTIQYRQSEMCMLLSCSRQKRQLARELDLDRRQPSRSRSPSISPLPMRQPTKQPLRSPSSFRHKRRAPRQPNYPPPPGVSRRQSHHPPTGVSLKPRASLKPPPSGFAQIPLASARSDRSDGEDFADQPPPQGHGEQGDLPSGFESVWNDRHWSWNQRRGWMRHGQGWRRQPTPFEGPTSDAARAREVDVIPAPLCLAMDKKGKSLLDLASVCQSSGTVSEASAQEWVTICHGTSSVAGNSACHYLAHNGGAGRKPWGAGVSYKDSHTSRRLSAQ